METGTGDPHQVPKVTAPRVTAGWVVATSRRSLDDRLRTVAESPPTWKRVLAATRTRTVVVAGLYLALLGVLIVLKTKSFHVWSSLAPEDAASTLQTLWQVHAALVSLGFPFLLLLIQFSHDDGVKAARSSDVLAQETHVRPALEFAAGGLAAITIITAWLVSDSAVVVGVGLLLSALGVLVWCYFRAIDLLMDRPEMRRLSGRVLRGRLKDSMTELWVLRAGNNLLQERLVSVGARSGYVWEAALTDDWWVLPAPCTGLVTDVQIEELVGLVDALPRSTAPLAEREPLVTRSATPSGDDDRIRLHCLCGDRVRQGQPVLSLRRSSFALSVPPAIPLERIIKIDESSSPADRFKWELAILRDQVSRSIRETELGDLSDGLDLYGELLTTVLDTFRLYERAMAGPLPEAEVTYGREMLWMQDDLQSIMRVAVTRSSMDAALAVLAFLQSVTTEALDREELPAFVSFLGAHRIAWYEAKKAGGQDDWPQLREMILRSLDAFGTYHIGPRLRVPASATEAAPFARHLLAEIVLLMKASVDSGDADDLRCASRMFTKTMRHSIREADSSPTGEADTDEIYAGNSLLVFKAAGLLGIEAWILLRQNVGESVAEVTTELLGAVSGQELLSVTHLPGLLRWHAYLTASAIEPITSSGTDHLPIGELLAWKWWESQFWDDEQAGFLSYNSFLDKAFARQLVEGRAWIPNSVQPTEALSYHASQLLQQLADLRKQSEIDPVLAGSYHSESTLRAEERLTTIRQEILDANDSDLISRDIEPSLVDTFRQGVVESWQDPIYLRSMCRELAWSPVRADDSDAGTAEKSPSDPKSFGSNVLVPKDYFVTRDAVHADSLELGHEYGASLGRGEDDQILDLLRDNLTAVETSSHELGATIERVVRDLRARRLNPSLVVFNPWPLMGALRDLGYDAGASRMSDATPDAQRLPRLDVPVLLRHAQGDTFCLLVDLAATVSINFALVKHNRASVNLNDRIEAGGRILVGVDPIDDDLAQQLLQHNPRLRLGDGDREVSLEVASRDLMKLARVRIFEWVSFDIVDALGGVVVKVRDDDD